MSADVVHLRLQRWFLTLIITVLPLGSISVLSQTPLPQVRAVGEIHDKSGHSLSAVPNSVDLNLEPVAKYQASGASQSAGGQTAQQPPTFTPAGVQGTLAPSGYSAAAAAEDTSQVMRRAADLGQSYDFFLSEIAGPIPGCSDERRLLAAVQLDPKRFDANHALGIFYLYHRDFSRSLTYLRRASSVRPSDPGTLRDIALAYIGDKQASQAVAILQDAAGKNRTDAALARSLAMAFEASQDPRNAILEYQRAASIDTSEQNLFASGIGLIRVGAADQAATLFGSATAANPGAAELWMGLGISQYLQQHRENALHSLLRATELDPEYLASYSFLALVYGAVPASDAEIMRRLKVLVVTHPESGRAHFDYALALLKESHLSVDVVPAFEIVTQLKLAIERDPNLADAHLQLGAFYANSKDYAKAIGEYQKTLQLEPENVRVHYRLALLYRRNKQPALSDDELRKFKTLDPSLSQRQDALSDDAPGLRSMSPPGVVGESKCP